MESQDVHDILQSSNLDLYGYLQHQVYEDFSLMGVFKSLVAQTYSTVNV